MKSNVKRLFAGPYILWMSGFTIIPLLLIVYYGLTTKSGAFTLANVCSITTPEHMKALLLSLGLRPPSACFCPIRWLWCCAAAALGQAASWYSSSSFRCG